MRPLFYDHRIFNAGGDVHGRTNAAGARMRNSGHFDATAAGTARLNVDIEHPLQLIPLLGVGGHAGMGYGRLFSDRVNLNVATGSSP